jgi:UDP-glucuronate 4-epimerase
MDMGDILVTGGAGFIGSHLVGRLLGEGRRVICLDNFDPFYEPEMKRDNIRNAMNHGAFRLYEGDIRDEHLLGCIFGEHEILTVVHLAAKVGVRSSLREPTLYEDVNIGGTLRLLEVCREHPVERFVLASSSSVYGDRSTLPFSESDAVDRPISPYAATKRACELLGYTYSHLYRLPVVCLRFFTVYGPRQRPDMAIRKFIALIDAGQELPLYGDGRSRRDYTYIDDAIRGIVGAMEADIEFEIVNIGDSRTVELRELVSLISNYLGKEALIRELPRAPGDVGITFADIRKAKHLLGYEPTVDIEEGIRRTIGYYREQGSTASG